MTDSELLERAALAAGITGFWVDAGLNITNDAAPVIWNPLHDDGAALRLLARLRLTLDYRPGYVGVHKGFSSYIGQCPHDEDAPHDTAPTRRAIVRAAAALAPASTEVLPNRGAAR